MPQPTDQQVQVYAEILTEIRTRLDNAGQFLRTGPSRSECEVAALNLRLVIEMVVMSSLVTNSHEAAAVSEALHKKGHDKAAKLVRTVNPDYWPKPFTEHRRPDGLIEQVPTSTGFLPEAEWRESWGRLSELLHAPNPLAPASRDSHQTWTWLVDLHRRLIVLTARHQLSLPDPHWTFIGNFTPDGRAQATLWQGDASP